jgi:heterodisulfide reductase subunit C
MHDLLSATAMQRLLTVAADVRTAAICPLLSSSSRVEAILRRYMHYGVCTATCPTIRRSATS